MKPGKQAFFHFMGNNHAMRHAIMKKLKQMKRMKQLPALYTPGILLGTLLLLGGCSSSKQAADAPLQKSSWQQTPLVIDGSDSDWVQPLANYDRREKMSYAVTNDNEHLYLRLSTNDEQTQQKILQGGLTVWINTHGERTEEKAAGIAFPTGNTHEGGKSILTAGRPEMYKNKIAALDNVKDYSLYGFTRERDMKNYNYGESNEQGVELKIDFNNAGALIYEAAVPLSSLFPKNNGLGKSIAVGFVLDEAPQQTARRRNGGGGGVSIGGGLGMGSFGSGGGVGLSIGSGALGRIGGGGGRLRQSKIWQLVTLAKPSGHSGN